MLAEDLPVVGGEAAGLEEPAGLLRTLRKSMGRSPARLLGIPMPAMWAMARLAALNPNSPLTPDTLAMLEQGSTADPARFTEILGHPPRPPEAFETA